MRWGYMLSYLAVTLFTASCDDKAQLKVEKYSNGNIKSEIFFLNDTVKHGPAKYYYINGELKGELSFSNGKRNGLAKYYFSNGRLEGEVNYEDGLLEGEAKWYHSNGQLKSKSFRERGREYGSTYFYNPQGQLEAYQCKDFEGNVVYIRKLDETGNVIKEEGVVFSPKIKVLSDDSSALKVDKPAKFLITVAQPPGYSASIWTRDFLNGNVMSRESHLIENSTVTVERFFSNAGKQGLIVIGELRNQSNGLVARDSIVKVVDIKATD